MKKFTVLSAKFWPLLFLGLIIRLLLMPTTLHPDLWAISFSQKFFVFDGITNIYDYLAGLPSSSDLVVNYGRNFFTYPPLAYFSLGIFGFLLKPFFNADFFTNLASNLPYIYNDNRLYWHLFLTKFPYLFFDFGALYFLVKLFDGEKEKKKAALFWLFNPLTLYTSYMIGQFDIIPVFFCVLSLYLAKGKKLYLSALALGVGGAFKMFPLFFLPFLIFNFEGNLLKKIRLTLMGIFPFVITILPFVNSAGFKQNVLFSNQSEKMLFAKIPVSGAEYLSLFVVIYIFLLIFSFVKKMDLWKWFLVVILLFFSVTHYHPQWFLWATPFLIIFLVIYPRFWSFPVILFFCWFFIMIFFEPSLSIGLFAPISNSLTAPIPLSDVVNHYYNVFQFKSIIRSIFAGTSSFLIFKLFTQKNNVV